MGEYNFVFWFTFGILFFLLTRNFIRTIKKIDIEKKKIKEIKILRK